MREIHWTDESEEHIWTRHKVTPEEVEQVVYTRPRYVANGVAETQYVYGQTDAGRYLFIVVAESLTSD